MIAALLGWGIPYSLLIFGFGILFVQWVDDRNLRRSRAVDADTDVKLAEGRANQAVSIDEFNALVAADLAGVMTAEETQAQR